MDVERLMNEQEGDYKNYRRLWSEWCPFHKVQFSQSHQLFILRILTAYGSNRARLQLDDYTEDPNQKLFRKKTQMEVPFTNTTLFKITVRIIWGLFIENWTNKYGDGLSTDIVKIIAEFAGPSDEHIVCAKNCVLSPGIEVYDGQEIELHEDWTKTFRIQALVTKMEHGVQVNVDVHPWNTEKKWYSIMLEKEMNN